MLTAILKSALVFALIPIFTLAIEPTNPVGLCDRFLGDEEKADCVSKISTADLDWYAASACSLQQEDKNFHSCLKEIQQASFNPEALELCAKDPSVSDELRFTCIQKIKGRDYTRAQMKKCVASGSTESAIQCLGQNSENRVPASSGKKSGFQSLELRK